MLAYLPILLIVALTIYLAARSLQAGPHGGA